jgi:hypothetical protein
MDMIVADFADFATVIDMIIADFADFADEWLG